MPLTKSKFREKCLKIIRNSSNHNKIYKTSILSKKLLEELDLKKRASILIYYPLAYEADIVKLLYKLRKKHDVFIPFMQGESFKMVPFRLPLKKKRFGIFEAGDTLRNINKIDIAIVPTVGVDGNLQRIGFGRGMYDRFFEKLKKKPYTIFIQPEFCYTQKLLCDAYDVKGDVLITPTKTIRNRAISRKRA